MHQIWVITDENGKIKQCWECPIPANPDDPDMPPIRMTDKNGNENMPANWSRFKVPEPSNFKNIKQKAKEKKKSISGHILDGYEVKNEKLKKRGK